MRRGRDDRDHPALAHGLVQRIAELVVAQLLAVEVPRQEVLVGLDDGFDELLPILADPLGLVLG